MPQYLITISIGPVQDFIAAARKTRDLWMGSYLLSEISKATAQYLHEERGKSGELIFPYSKNLDNDLQLCNKVDGCFNVGNKLLALIDTDKEPQDIIEKANEVAQKRWEAIANEAKDTNKAKDLFIDMERWNHQVDDVIEFYASWVIFDSEKNNNNPDYYNNRRERVDRLLNARKNTREFQANPITENGIPKSSLDGLRETVIDLKGVSKTVLRKAKLNKGEYLDVTGVAKRLAEDDMLDQFTPLSRLAIDPWLRQLENPINLDTLKKLMQPLTKAGIASKVTGNEGMYADFPYDGQLLYDFRIQAELAKLDEKDDEELIEQLKALEQFTKGLNNPNGPPEPYMAIMAADGDQVGALLDEMQSLTAHQNISQALTLFATEVPNIVSKFRGHCIYAGGDDVLALLPLDQAIACGKALAVKFAETMLAVNGVKELAENGTIEPPTLSVGLGISHFMTPMPKQLELARRAEKLAKSNESTDKKNALALIVNPRSGAEISFRERWDKGADIILCKWIEAHLTGELPRRAGYNLREESISLEWSNEDPAKYETLITAETRRILGRKRKHTNDSADDLVDSHWADAVANRAKEKGLAKTADELIMTYRIAQAYKLSGYEPPKKEKQEGENV